MIRSTFSACIVATAMAFAVGANAQTATTAPAPTAQTTPPASSAATTPSTKAASRAKRKANSRANPTVCAHLPPNDREGCMAKEKSKSDAALTKSASGAGGGSIPRGDSGSAKGQ